MASQVRLRFRVPGFGHEHDERENDVLRMPAKGSNRETKQKTKDMEEIIMIPESLRQMEERFSSKMLEVSGIDPRQKKRSWNNTFARASVAYALYNEGYTQSQVGRVMGMNHSTIHYYLGRMDDILHTPGYEAEREMFAQFKKAIWQ